MEFLPSLLFLESRRAALNVEGKISLHVEYDAWGSPKSGLCTGANYAGLEAPNNFTGYTYDITLGLYFAQSLFYDSDDHRFISEDAAKDGSNWYIYCMDNPVMYVDADGLYAKLNGHYISTYQDNNEKSSQ